MAGGVDGGDDAPSPPQAAAAAMPTDDASSDDGISANPVPVSIVTGFLGAGKTTFLRHVLANPHGMRVAVIQNELSAATGLEADTKYAFLIDVVNGPYVRRAVHLTPGGG